MPMALYERRQPRGGESMRGLRNLEYERAGKIWKAIVPEKHLSMFCVKCQLSNLILKASLIFYAIFCFNFSLYWYCSWHTK